jgi:hypothetical protein
MNTFLFFTVLLLSMQTKLYAQNITILVGEIDCKISEENYIKVINDLSTNCSAHDECHVDRIAWNPNLLIGHRETEEQILKLTRIRADLHERCHYVAPKTGACLPRKAICLNRKCQNYADLQPLHNKDITFRFTNKGAVLKNQTISLSVDTGVRCITTPCPSRIEVHSLLTNDVGEATITLGKFQLVLNKKNESIGPDGLAFILENIGYEPVDFNTLLIDTNKINEIPF